MLTQMKTEKLLRINESLKTDLDGLKIELTDIRKRSVADTDALQICIDMLQAALPGFERKILSYEQKYLASLREIARLLCAIRLPETNGQGGRFLDLPWAESVYNFLVAEDLEVELRDAVCMAAELVVLEMTRLGPKYLELVGQAEV